MSSSYVPEGKTVDFETDPNILILNLIKDNWTKAGAGGDDMLTLADKKVKLTTTYDDYVSPYQVIVRPVSTDIAPAATGGARDKFVDYYHVEVWAKGKSGRDKMWKMMKEVLQIVNRTKHALKDHGIREMMAMHMAEQTRNDGNNEWFAKIITVRLRYHKVVI